MIEMENVDVEIQNQLVMKDFSLFLKKGKIHAIMGPNGVGKSTFAKVLAGHPAYHVKKGKILFEKKNLFEFSSEMRALMGLFVSFQYPLEIAGISNELFLRTAYNAKRKFQSQPPLNEKEFSLLLEEKMTLLEMREEFKTRNLNEGFSGGEKKRNEILQMALLEPKVAILDEIDSGLDIDALKVVTRALTALKTPDNTFVFITHYPRVLEYIQPDFVHVMKEGRIVKTGDFSLALELEKKGYDLIYDQISN